MQEANIKNNIDEDEELTKITDLLNVLPENDVIGVSEIYVTAWGNMKQTRTDV